MIEINRINKAKADIKRALNIKNSFNLQMETLQICLELLNNYTDEKKKKKKQMLILVIIAIILVVSYGINIYVEENNKEVTKEFIDELVKQNEMLKDQNNYLKKLRK